MSNRNRIAGKYLAFGLVLIMAVAGFVVGNIFPAGKTGQGGKEAGKQASSNAGQQEQEANQILDLTNLDKVPSLLDISRNVYDVSTPSTGYIKKTIPAEVIKTLASEGEAREDSTGIISLSVPAEDLASVKEGQSVLFYTKDEDAPVEIAKISFVPEMSDTDTGEKKPGKKIILQTDFSGDTKKIDSARIIVQSDNMARRLPKSAVIFPDSGNTDKKAVGEEEQQPSLPYVWYVTTKDENTFTTKRQNVTILMEGDTFFSVGEEVCGREVILKPDANLEEGKVVEVKQIFMDAPAIPPVREIAYNKQRAEIIEEMKVYIEEMKRYEEKVRRKHRGEGCGGPDPTAFDLYAFTSKEYTPVPSSAWVVKKTPTIGDYVPGIEELVPGITETIKSIKKGCMKLGGSCGKGKS